MSTIASKEPPRTESQSGPRRRGCLFSVGRGILVLVALVAVLVLLGVAYQAIASGSDKAAFTPRGQLYPVNGHPMHMVCMGEGSPAIVLEAGAAAESLWWIRVQTQLAEHTKVCAYDRPGHGWSEPTTEPRDAITLVTELHALLEQAEISPPYLVVGHSYGALWTRIFASRYRDEVTGAVLVDSSLLIPEQFASQEEFDDWKASNDSIQLLPRVALLTGVIRLTGPSTFSAAGYSPELVPELVTLQARTAVLDADYAEQIAARREFTEAAANARDFGEMPLGIVWASDTYTMMQAISELRQASVEMKNYSTDTSTRIIAGASHGSLLGSESHARQVADAVLEVLAAARSGQPLAQ
ncbi:MAG: alpha/beta hydrolase [Chloroflexi bacterium]|nr:alpha/beta hydrolase [Chloroflexota bacterium]